MLTSYHLTAALSAARAGASCFLFALPVARNNSFISRTRARSGASSSCRRFCFRRCRCGSRPLLHAVFGRQLRLPQHELRCVFGKVRRVAVHRQQPTNLAPQSRPHRFALRPVELGHLLAPSPSARGPSAGACRTSSLPWPTRSPPGRRRTPSPRRSGRAPRRAAAPRADTSPDRCSCAIISAVVICLFV